MILINLSSDFDIAAMEDQANIKSTVSLTKKTALNPELSTVVFCILHNQFCKNSYHIGQIVFIGKVINNEKWSSLSIPKGKSKEYNKDKFSKPKRTEHFTDDL